VCWVAGEPAGLVFLAGILLGGLIDLAGLSGGARLSTALTLGVGRLTTLVWGRHGGLMEKLDSETSQWFCSYSAIGPRRYALPNS
jgi:hypothetical protein